MKSSNKLQNIKAVQQMIDGTHKFQTKKTVGFSDAESTALKSQHRNIGDSWKETDANGVTYIIEQRDGFRIKKTATTNTMQQVRNELYTFKNCRKDVCTCTGTHPLDQKMKKIHDMCFDCVIEMEHEMKLNGTYSAYAKNKVRENALAWLRDAERDVEMLKQAYTQSIKFVNNSEGEIETWAAKMTPEEFEEKIQLEFDKFKENFLIKLNGVTGTENEKN